MPFRFLQDAALEEPPANQSESLCQTAFTRAKWRGRFIGVGAATLGPLIAATSRVPLRDYFTGPKGSSNLLLEWSYLQSTLNRLRRFIKRRVRQAWRWIFPVRSISEGQVHFTHLIEIASRAPRVSSPLRIAFVVPVYNTNPAYLDSLLASVRTQRPGAWELIFSDDGSDAVPTRTWLTRHMHDVDLTILRSEQNRGIAAATNAAIAVASADWIGLLDHDDGLAPYAVDRILAALAAAPDCQFLYTDEVIANAALEPIELMLKPAFDPVMLSGVNYINHLSLYRRNKLLGIGGLREGFEGSQDYDLVLRYTKNLKRHECLHLPYPAYLWRRDGNSYSALHFDQATRSARAALGEAYASDGVSIQVSDAVGGNLHRLRFDLTIRQHSKVSVIIPNRDSYELINRTLHGVLEQTDYPNIEVIVIDNGSEDPRVLDLYAQRTAGSVPFSAIVEREPFNFSRAINKGIARATGDLILLLNNDVEILEPSWLNEMVSCFDYPDVAIVGAKLLYPDRTIQHAGVIVGFGGLAGHWYLNKSEDFPGPFGRLWVRQSMSCVTGACMLISKSALAKLGPLDEEDLPIAYNDVDLCMKAIKGGMRVVWTPFATLIHHESASRGSDETEANIVRFRREQSNLRNRHATDVYADFAINPLYSTDRSTPIVVLPPSLPAAR